MGSYFSALPFASTAVLVVILLRENDMENCRNIINRYNGEVNGYFLCDRGRFGYEFVNSENRITQPLVMTRQ